MSAPDPRPAEERSLPALVGRLSADVLLLVEAEMQRLRRDVRVEVRRGARAAVGFGIGLIFVGLSTAALTVGASMVIGDALGNRGLGALIVGGVLAVLAGAVFWLSARGDEDGSDLEGPG